MHINATAVPIAQG